MIFRRSLISMALAATLSSTAWASDQASLQPVLNAGDSVLKFDWPTVLVGTGEYQEGPTGVTVFRFTRRVFAAVDVRGGGPGTVNTDYLRIGYEVPEVDSVVFSGGSWYGLEGTTAVATALKDDGIRGGIWDNIALSVGAIIYDFGDRRLNEIYPDKRLAQAAARAARPGMFPLGAHGAGRMTKTGHIFDCGAYSGQGGAFKQIGDLKIAAFTVVNAVGVVTDRDGRVAACYRDKDWPKGELQTSELLAAFPASSRQGAWRPMAQHLDAKRNTTISLVITNQKLDRARLERLATQVHSSMGRALQPFATELDGDVLYAVSTAELDRPVDQSDTPNVDLDIIASELMWDAVLASIPPQQPARQHDPSVTFTPAQLRGFAGEYVFSSYASVRVSVEGDKLMAQATGTRPGLCDPQRERRRAAAGIEDGIRRARPLPHHVELRGQRQARAQPRTLAAGGLTQEVMSGGASTRLAAKPALARERSAASVSVSACRHRCRSRRATARTRSGAAIHRSGRASR